MPVSQRVHESTFIARLIGRLKTEHVEMVYTHVGVIRRRCPDNTKQLKCKITMSDTSATNCSSHTISQNISSANIDSTISYTHNAVSHVMSEGTVWNKLSQQSRNFLRSTRFSHAADTVNTSAYLIFGDYSTVIDELVSLLLVALRDVRLPRLLLCVHCDTALFTSVSGLQALAFAQHATGSQCSLGHVFYACGGHLGAAERFYFRSNWSRSESKLREVRYCYADSTTALLYSDTIVCPQRILSNISASILQSRGCTATDDVIGWYSACKQVMTGTNSVTESLIEKSRTTLSAVYQHCVVEVIVYAFLILAEVQNSIVSFWHN